MSDFHIASITKIVGFNHKRFTDVASLVLTLIAAIVVPILGLASPADVTYYFGIIVSYFLIKGLLLFLAWLGGLFRSGWEWSVSGWRTKRQIIGCNDMEKFIITHFIESNSKFHTFNSRSVDLNYLEELQQRGILTSEPFMPNDDVGQLEFALGHRFARATLSDRVFKYLTKSHCNNAVKLGFILHRADVRQYWRERGVTW